MRRPPRPTLFPYTTLFRSGEERLEHVLHHFGRHAAAVVVEFEADVIGLLSDVDSQRTAALHRIEGVGRSEEHTSELQSHSDLVCRLLLEKKKHTARRTCTA